MYHIGSRDRQLIIAWRRRTHQSRFHRPASLSCAFTRRRARSVLRHPVATARSIENGSPHPTGAIGQVSQLLTLAEQRPGRQVGTCEIDRTGLIQVCRLRPLASNLQDEPHRLISLMLTPPD
jgi:hypothetical protein